MILFHRLRQHHHHHHAHSASRPHHEHHRHGAWFGHPLAGFAGHAADAAAQLAGDPGDALLERIAARLDLGAEQRERLAELLAQLQRQRRALKAWLGGPELAELLAGDNFARERAQALLEQRLEALRSAGPALVTALGDFFDALDFEQQQALRFQLRRLRQRRGER
ncbi:hypothetical protein G8A07_11280 [Roseateles sp. DAIF2]|uniref:Spy/CpxP family protein refolding chaperone n=1 Tax=Roseateles sp. DAIF2 TaxID=2714952 RepID=UPI0018A27194|nr:Spy/CpxP family protein refolding chaperone [Roseateles sp. DAIF2]QPF73446.1 hypothetical protein G8A07_11280 [Roseateles sp. DAIF2]